MSNEREIIAVIDGNSLMHRAFHAIQQPMNASDGRPTNALFGFFNMFIKLVESFKPTGIICAFDKGKPKIRTDMYSDYKAQRPPMDPSLHEQFPMVKELLSALAVPVVELEGWEGDDILGTIAAKGEAAGYEMLLFTGDRDMYQLASEHVKIVSTKRGLSDVSIMTPESVDELYHGISPELVPDFYGLKGDSSDNIPGVPGIGPKKAAALIVEYGNLDEVLAHADEVKGKMGENLRAHKDDALISRDLARIFTNAPIEVDFEAARFPNFDAATVSAAFSALDFTTITRRLLRLGGTDGLATSSSASSALASEDFALLPDADAAKLLESINQQIDAPLGYLGLSLEAKEQKRGQLSLNFDEAQVSSQVLWLSASGGLVRLEGEELTDVLERILGKIPCASLDVKELVHVLSPVDSSIPARASALELDSSKFFDCSVAAYLLDSDAQAYTPEFLAENYLATLPPDASDELPQAAINAVLARLLVEPMTSKLEKDGALKLYREIELPLLPVLAQMEREGLLVDPQILAAQSRELGAEIASMADTIHEAAGEDFNIDSPMQLSHVLFDVLELPTAGLKKTQRGYYSTNANVLDDLARDYKIVADVLEYRERAKIKSTYLDALPELIAGDGRIHTSFNQTVAATGRLSSSEPNLQNIPTRSELGHRVRRAFIVGDDKVFLACDYSQIELRLLAHLSKDENLIAAFNGGEDFHAATAARAFGVDIAEVTPQLRSRAKAVNFGIVYGQQAYGLASSLKIPRAEAQGMIDRYFDAYPCVRSFLDAQVAFARDRGYVETMYGRRRYTKDINSRNFQQRAFAERTAMNHPMQGTAADIIKIAMIRMADALKDSALDARLTLQIHDELDFEVAKKDVAELSALVKETMEAVAELSVPLIADVSLGNTWAEAK